jgi:hypothetical protein
MTEEQWLVCDNAHHMIWALFSRSRGGRIKDERFRRVGIACCRRVAAALPGGSSPALDILEDFIDSRDSARLADARKAHGAAMKAGAEAPFGEQARRWAAAAVIQCARGKPTMAALANQKALGAMAEIKAAEGGWGTDKRKDIARYRAAEHAELAVQAALVRDIFGNPFRPVSVDPAWLTPTVVSLVQAAYDERPLPSGELEPARLAVLADALEEAGCTDAEILTHLRSPGPHVRGCWALDLVLGKE